MPCKISDGRVVGADSISIEVMNSEGIVQLEELAKPCTSHLEAKKPYNVRSLLELL